MKLFKDMRTLFFYISLAAMVLALASCGDSYKDKQRKEQMSRAERFRQDSLALKIATTPTLDCLPLFIGVDDSAFVRNGVDVRLRHRAAQIDCDTLMRGGYVEGMVSDLIRTERLRSEGVALRYVAATNAYWKLVANRTARVKEIKQLSDKMLAMTRYSATDFLADMAVDSGKPKEQVFRVQINDVRIRLKMVLNNEMDAALLTEPQATAAVLQKNPVLMDSRQKNLHLGVVAFSEKSLEDKRRQKQLADFLKVYNAMCDSINKNGLQHYAAIISKYTGADSKTVAALPKITFAHAAEPRQRDVDVARKRWKK